MKCDIISIQVIKCVISFYMKEVILCFITTEMFHNRIELLLALLEDFIAVECFFG